MDGCFHLHLNNESNNFDFFKKKYYNCMNVKLLTLNNLKFI